ncbi:MAG: ABC transporter ATP-binding protein [Deltaproteobacteria bacterium]|nr:ABC transporter ATP-binding protein [Deltaproteobacteria bacterium]
MYLELIQIRKTFVNPKQDTEVVAIDRIDLQIEKGQFISIVGPSGCGKTSLLRIISGLENSYEGDVFLDGKKIQKPESEVGLVFQQYALFPWRTMCKNIEIGLEIMGMRKSERRAIAMEYIRSFGMSGFEDRYPYQLSGGMQQRVAIARTLIMNPKVVLMDEPFGSLDSQTRNDMQEFLMDLRQKRNDTILFVTHNVDESVFLSDRIVVLSKRPARILRIFEINTPHPRDRTSKVANDIRREVIEILRQERISHSPVNN